MEKIYRNYLEIMSLEDLLYKKKPNNTFKIEKISKTNFQLNKFFYKQIGKKHEWNDRLLWDDSKWIGYVSNSSVTTFVLKKNTDLAGFFELIYHKNSSEVEIAYLGILHEFLEQKLGGYMLSEAIKISFSYNVKRVWVHTCSLDHKNALNNYLARGMKIYNTEKINFKSA